MAAPQTKSTKDLNGNWVMNKYLSDSSDPILKVQGIGYFPRKGVGLATINLNIKQYEAVPMTSSLSTDEVTCIESTQTASGLKSTKEMRYLDNEFRDHHDWLFGKLKVQARWVGLGDIDDPFLKEGFLVEGEGKDLVLSHAVSQGNGWTATQVWGFQVVDDERRYCMRVVVVLKDGQKAQAQARFVYDYQQE